MKIKIFVFPKKGMSDPQSDVITSSLKSMNIETSSVTRGKFFTLNVPNITREEAESMVDKECKKLFVNKIIEDYDYEIIED